MDSTQLYALLAEALAAHDLFQERPTQFGSRDRKAWYIRNREVAHIHTDGWIDVKLTKEVRAKLRGDPRAKSHPNSDWVEFLLSEQKDVQFAADLLMSVYSDTV
jgi:hypothetical protein